jgi:drug/metabolite transporter (DMT)-like permease
MNHITLFPNKEGCAKEKNMEWFWLSLGSAYFMATEQMLSKLLLEKNDPWSTAWLMCSLSLPFLALGLWGEPLISLGKELLLLLAVLMPLEITAYYLYLTAIQIAPLSLTIPFMAFTPVFTILTAWIFLGETVSLRGLVGIVLVCSGGYVLQADQLRFGLIAPVKAAFLNRGPRYMILVALIYSVTSTLGKVGVQITAPLWFGFIYMGLLSVIFTVIQGFRMKYGKPALHLKGRYGLWAGLGGLTMALMMAFHYLAIEKAPVSYMISIKRTSLLFAVLYGWIIFKEELIAFRLAGGMVMVGGIFFIYFR